MKTLLGSEITIYLLEVKRKGSGLEMFINDVISEDMLEIDHKDVKFIGNSCLETLSRYKHLTNSNILMDVHLVEDGMEVNLPQGFGKHIPDKEKTSLFDDAAKIGNLLIDVMDRDESPGAEFEAMVRESAQDEWQGENEEYSIELQKEFSGYKQVTPDILPEGIVASRGRDHRGYCLIIDHEDHGYLGRLIITPHSTEHSQMLSEVPEEVMNDEIKFDIFKNTLEKLETGMEMTYKMNHNIKSS